MSHGCPQCRVLGVPCPECRILTEVDAPPAPAEIVKFLRARATAARGHAETRRKMADEIQKNDPHVAGKHRLAARAYDAEARRFEASAELINTQQQQIRGLEVQLADLNDAA